jgi:DNA-binding CsgD family transcriptional regulator
MTIVSLIGEDPAARARIRRVLEAAGFIVAGETDGEIVVEERADRPSTEMVETLTRREREVLDLLAEGHSNRRIAQRLGISEHTAKFHVASIYGKLGVASRAETIRAAVRRGLIAI